MQAMDTEPSASPEALLKRSAGTRRLLGFLRVAAAVAIVVALVRAIGPQDVLVRIGTCPPGTALAAFAATMVSQWLAAHRLRLLARSQGFKLSGSEAVLIGLSAVFYGLFVPGGSATGWAVRLLRLSRGTGRITPGLQLLAGDRALSTASGAAIGVAAGLFIGESAPGWIAVLLLAVTAGAILLSLALFAPSRAPPMAWARRVPLLERVTAKVAARGSLLRRPDSATVLVATGLSFAAHAGGVLAWVLLAQAMGLDLDAVSIAWVRSAAMVATLLPATIGGLGLRDGAVVYLMGTLGIAAAVALSLSLLVFAATIFAVGIVGGVLEALDLVRRRR